MSADTPTPLSNAQQIQGKIAELQQQLEMGSPGYAGLLHTIHQALLKDEETVNLLKPEEIGIICAGLSKRKNVIIADNIAKVGGRGNKASTITLADL